MQEWWRSGVTGRDRVAAMASASPLALGEEALPDFPRPSTSAAASAEDLNLSHSSKA